MTTHPLEVKQRSICLLIYCIGSYTALILAFAQYGKRIPFVEGMIISVDDEEPQWM